MRRRKNETGQALVLTALSLFVLIGFAGLGIDMGVLRYERRLQQTAADAAAIAGANDIRYSSGTGVVGAGKDAASKNGFTDSVNNVTVTINHNPGPTTGPHTGNPNYVEAFVTAVQPTYFMRIFNVPSKTVTTRAVATLVGENSTSPGCVYTLGPPGTGVGVTTGGTPTVNAPTCGFYDAGNFTTNGSRVDISAGNIGVVGTDRNNGGGTVTCAASTTNCPVTGVAPTGDPLSFLAPPCSPCSGGANLNISSSQTVSPGTYSSISITGGTVDFQPGTYIVNGNFTLNGNAIVCNSTNIDCSGMPTSANSGVTFYIDNGGSISINGTSTVQFTAPNSGTYAGILFYQDPSDTSTATLNGTNSSFYQGGLYFPGTQLTFGGTNFTNASAAYTLIVANDLKFNGTATININSNYSSLPGSVSIIENAILVE
jgi:hypothetical protein